MQNTTRGSYDVAFTEDGVVKIACWDDNSVVILLKNWDVLEHLVNAKRFLRNERMNISIS